eukprot:7067242-Prymnesium_polylepis.1
MLHAGAGRRGRLLAALMVLRETRGCDVVSVGAQRHDLGHTRSEWKCVSRYGSRDGRKRREPELATLHGTEPSSPDGAPSGFLFETDISPASCASPQQPACDTHPM